MCINNPIVYRIQLTNQIHPRIPPNFEYHGNPHVQVLQNCKSPSLSLLFTSAVNPFIIDAGFPPDSSSLCPSVLFEEHVEEFSVEASAGVQEEAQCLESLPVLKRVP